MKQIDAKDEWKVNFENKENKSIQYQNTKIASLYMIEADVTNIPMKNFVNHIFDIDTRIKRYTTP